MVHRKYIKRNGKVFGPYLYDNKRINGKVVSKYLGLDKESKLSEKDNRENKSRLTGDTFGYREDLLKKVGNKKFDRVFGKGYKLLDTDSRIKDAPVISKPLDFNKDLIQNNKDTVQKMNLIGRFIVFFSAIALLIFFLLAFSFVEHSIGIFSSDSDIESFEIDESFLLLAPLTPGNINSCGELNTAGTYTLTQDVISTGTCFNVNVNGVTLDCEGFTIKYQTDGVALNNVNNILIKDCSFDVDKSTIISGDAGIQFTNSDATIESIVSVDGTALFFVSTTSTIRTVNVFNSNLIDSRTNSYNIGFEFVSGSLGYDGNSYYDVNLISTPFGDYNVNTDVNFGNRGSKKISVAWWFEVQVNSGGSPLSGATVTAKDAGMIERYNEVSGADGKTARKPLIERYRFKDGDAFTEGTYNQYTVEASKAAYETITKPPVTVNSNRIEMFDLAVAVSISACPFNIILPGTYSLTADLNSDNTCITVSASNVVIDGDNGAGGRRKITYAKTSNGRGVSVNPGYSNIGIKNIEFIQTLTSVNDFSDAVNIYNSNAVKLSNNVINTAKGDGIEIVSDSNSPIHPASIFFEFSNNNIIVNGVNRNGISLRGNLKGIIQQNMIASNAMGTSNILIMNDLFGVPNPDMNTISSNNLNNGGDNSKGINIQQGGGQIVSDNFISMTGASGANGLVINTPTNNLLNTFSRNIITILGTNSHGIILNSPQNDFIDGSVQTFGVGANAITASGSVLGNRFVNYRLESTLAGYEIYFDSTTSNLLNFIGVTNLAGNALPDPELSNPPSGFHTSSSANIDVYYYVSVQVFDFPTELAAVPLENVLINCMDNFGVGCFSGNTDVNGFVSINALAYSQNKNAIARFSPHTFTASYLDFPVQSTGQIDLITQGNVFRNFGFNTAPDLTFEPPTPADDSTVTTPSFFAQAMIHEHDNPTTLPYELYKLSYEFDGNRISLYDPSLVVMLNFDNDPVLGPFNAVTDASIYGNNAFNTQGFEQDEIVPGKYGNAFNLDGDLDPGEGDYFYLDSPSSGNEGTGLDLNSFTISAWVNFNALLENHVDTSIYSVVSKGAGGPDDCSGGAFAHNYHLLFDNAPQFGGQNMGVTIYFEDSCSVNVQSRYEPQAGFETNKWYHVVGIFDMPNDRIKLYLDGKKVSDSSAQGKAPNHNDIQVEIGRSFGDNNYFNGKIDEMRIWNRALSDADINLIFNSNLNKYNVNDWRVIVNQTDYNNVLSPNTYNFKFISEDSRTNQKVISRDIEVNIPPSVKFVDPTPADGASISTVSFDAYAEAATFSGNGLTDVEYTWDVLGIPQVNKLYSNQLLLLMNFNNVAELGEIGKVVDVSKESNDGTVVNANYVPNGKYGGGYYFDRLLGTPNVYVQLLKKNTLSNKAITAWIKRDNPTDHWSTIISAGCATNWYFAIKPDDNLIVSFNNAAGGTSCFASPSLLINDNNWHFVALVNYNEGSTTGKINRFDFYLDGVKSSCSPQNNGLATTLPASFHRIGSFSTVCGGDTLGGVFGGTIDELTIWDKTLTTQEVDFLYRSNLHKYNKEQWGASINQPITSDGAFTYQLKITDSEGEINTDSRVINRLIPFEIISIDPISSPQTITPNGIKTVTFYVEVRNSDLSGIIVSYDISGVIVRNGVTCTYINNPTSITARYRCDLMINYYDLPGTWNVNVKAQKLLVGFASLASGVVQPSFVLASTRALTHNSISWSNLNPATTNVYSDSPITITNVGNDAVTAGNVKIKGADLGSGNIQINRFKCGLDSSSTCASGLTLSTSSQIVTDANVPKYNGAVNSNKEELFVCLTSVPGGLPVGTYSGTWELTFPDSECSVINPCIL